MVAQIRIELSITIGREQRSAEPPHIDEPSGAYVENAGQQPMGFVIPSIGGNE